MPRRQEVFGQQTLPLGVGGAPQAGNVSGESYIPGTAKQWEPAPHVVAGAKRFAASQGREVDARGTESEQYQHRLGYQSMQEANAGRRSGGISPQMAESYEALRTEIGQQHAHMTAPRHQGGMGMKYEVTHEDPYPNAPAMAADVAKGRIRVLSTEATGGHSLLTNEENDKFRAVHDVMGHAATGRGFSRHGEQAAYAHHSQMFSEKARPALSAELRSQTSHLIFTGEFPPNAPAEQSQRVSRPR